MNGSNETVKNPCDEISIPDAQSSASTGRSKRRKYAVTVISLIIALLLTAFTVIVMHVRATGTFGIDTQEDRILTFMQYVVWFLTFVGAYKLLNLAADHVTGQDKASGEPEGESVRAARRHFLFCWNVPSVIVTALHLL